MKHPTPVSVKFHFAQVVSEQNSTETYPVSMHRVDVTTALDQAYDRAYEEMKNEQH